MYRSKKHVQQIQEGTNCQSPCRTTLVLMESRHRGLIEINVTLVQLSSALLEVRTYHNN